MTDSRPIEDNEVSHRHAVSREARRVEDEARSIGARIVADQADNAASRIGPPPDSDLELPEAASDSQTHDGES